MNNEETPASDYSEQAMANDNATETVPDSDAPANDGSVTEKERKEESPQRIESVEGIKEPIAEVKKEQSEQIITDDVESSSSRFWLIFGGIVIVGFISFMYWNYNNNADVKSDTVSMQAEAETNKYKERSEAVISKLTGEYGDFDGSCRNFRADEREVEVERYLNKEHNFKTAAAVLGLIILIIWIAPIFFMRDLPVLVTYNP